MYMSIYRITVISLLIAILIFLILNSPRSQDITIYALFTDYYISNGNIKLIDQKQILPNNHGFNCTIENDNKKFDCYPDAGATEEKCIARGCCWSTKLRSSSIGHPMCYFPYNYSSYIVTKKEVLPWGIKVHLQRNGHSPWPNDIIRLELDVIYEKKNTVHLKIYDPSSKRYEIPIELPNSTIHSEDSNMDVSIHNSPFGIQIIRKDTKTILFDSSISEAPLIYADQFIQISSKIPSSFLYGIGESTGPFLQNLSQWKEISLWARDAGPGIGNNLYGSQPFFLSYDENMQAFGIYLHNSNAVEFVLQPYPAVSFRTIGGILDFYIYSGPSADDVVRQHSMYIGKQFLVPYWSLGFHLCRYGLHDEDQLRNIIKRNMDIKIPYDTQWLDIDYMDGGKDWTVNDRFKSLPKIIDQLHNASMHFIMIADPCIDISHAGKYAPYDDGIKDDIFIKDENNDILVGSVWPGACAYPDFTHPNAERWWAKQASIFHKKFPFDGLWIDMNEPSNFVVGSVKGCATNNYNNPPYTPHIISRNLLAETICASAKQHASVHYNLHNIYGHMEANASFYALKEIFGNNRSVIISRSSFAGTGQFAGHWSGDITSSWQDLYLSIPQMLSFSMFNIPLFGADVCGFRGNTSPELCTRWMQLGAFYPFMRNHNAGSDQDPAVFNNTIQNHIRKALQLRYSLLPLLYTLMINSSLHGTPVVRPLVFEFPSDKNTIAVDRQFLWGSQLLVSPVLKEGAETVVAYFPHSYWYDFRSGKRINAYGEWSTLDAPLDVIPVAIQGNNIILTLPPDTTTTKSRTHPFTLIAALNSMGEAVGQIYWDDGISRDSVVTKQYNLINFRVENNTFRSYVLNSGFKSENNMALNVIRIFGVSVRPSSVIFLEVSIPFTYNDKVLELINFPYVTVLDKILITWI